MSSSYLMATVTHFPMVNGATRQATELADRLRPRVIEYVELLSKASKNHLKLDRLPEDPLTLSSLVAIALQVNPEVKQGLLEAPGVPELLALETRLICTRVPDPPVHDRHPRRRHADEHGADRLHLPQLKRRVFCRSGQFVLRYGDCGGLAQLARALR